MSNKRIDLYSILTKGGYKLPKGWIKSDHMAVRGHVRGFLDFSGVEVTEDVSMAIGLYTDKQWRRLFIRLDKHGHVQD